MTSAKAQGAVNSCYRGLHEGLQPRHAILENARIQGWRLHAPSHLQSMQTWLDKTVRLPSKKSQQPRSQNQIFKPHRWCTFATEKLVDSGGPQSPCGMCKGIRGISSFCSEKRFAAKRIFWLHNKWQENNLHLLSNYTGTGHGGLEWVCSN